MYGLFSGGERQHDVNAFAAVVGVDFGASLASLTDGYEEP